ncbi:hypothetical protein V5T82_04125 [Magnetovibrio sp. PR-2]|uniref:hypothetical protein n=1 Tax=Magnetovibrio sp. PR-2 TaxID=3120356 RepID=UPI002FCDF2CA
MTHQLNETQFETLQSDLIRARNTGKVACENIVREALLMPEYTIAHQIALDIEEYVIEHAAARAVRKFFAAKQQTDGRSIDEIIADSKAISKQYKRDRVRWALEDATRVSLITGYRVGQGAVLLGALALAPVAILGSTFGWGHSSMLGPGGRR